MASESSSPAMTEEERFSQALANSQKYPDNILLQDPPKLVYIFKRHFRIARDQITLITTGLSGFRLEIALRQVWLYVADRGRQAHGRSVSDSIDTLSSASSEVPYAVLLSKPDQLSKFLGAEASSPTGSIGGDASPFSEDPVARFVFLQTSPGITGGRRINITVDMLYQILTYHSVCPSFLYFISFYSGQPVSGETDMLFGNIRCRKYFSKPHLPMSALGRSGYHYQFVFELKTVFDTESPVEENEAAAEPALQRSSKRPPETRRKGFLSWLGRRRSQIENVHLAESTHAAAAFPRDSEDWNLPWPVLQTVVYHRFDVVSGKSLWILTTDNKRGGGGEFDAGSDLFDVRDITAVSTRKAWAETPIHQRFQSTLDEIVWLLDWSLSEYDLYLTRLDCMLGDKTRSALARDDGEFGNIVVNSIKGVARLIECVDECIVGLSANIRVAKALSDFFHHQLFQDPDLKQLDLEWLRHDDANARRNATEAAELLMGVHDQTNNMLRRAQAMKRRGTRREDVTHRIIQIRNQESSRDSQLATQRMNKAIQEDSKTMKVFSQVTLILLPMTVVSALFATDIVRFKDTPDFVGSWSGPAAIWWTCATLIATVVVYYASEFLRRKYEDDVDGLVDEDGEEVSYRLRGHKSSPVTQGRDELEGKRLAISWLPLKFHLFGGGDKAAVINGEREMAEYGSTSDDKADSGTNKGGWSSVSDWVFGTLRGRSGSETKEAHPV